MKIPSLWHKNCFLRIGTFHKHWRLHFTDLCVFHISRVSLLKGKIVHRFLTVSSILLLIFVSVLSVLALTPHRCLPVERQTTATHCAPVESSDHENSHNCDGQPHGLCCTVEHGTLPMQQAAVPPEQSRRAFPNDIGKLLSIAPGGSFFGSFSLPTAFHTLFQRAQGEAHPFTRPLFLLDSSYRI